MTINNVTIGDKFNSKANGNVVCEVVDFYEQKSIATGKVMGYICIAKGIDTFANNEFEVPFSTVVRFKIN